MAFEIVVPRLGWTMEEGTFAGWLKREGEFVRRGDALFSLEGEKAIQEIEALDEGILRIPIDGPAVGSIVKVGAVVGYLAAAEESLPPSPAGSINRDSMPAASALPPVASPSVRRRAREVGVELHSIAGSGPRGRITTEDVQRARAAPPRTAPSTTPIQRPAAELAMKGVVEAERQPVASPRARRVAAELAVQWRLLKGTGSHGRVRERDVRAAASQSPGVGLRRPISNRRRVIAERLVASRHQTVPVSLTTRADATNLVNLREQFKAVEGATTIPSYQDILIKLIAEVLARHLQLASRWEGDAIVVPRETELHIGLAVDTEDGLLVPVLRDIGNLTILALAAQSRRLVERAKAGKLSATEMQGGVFTVTNLGAFGIDAFTPVINLPESAILGLGAIRMEPVALADGQLVARQQMTLSLTFDHRVLDGAPAARFLQELVAAIANPSAVLLSGSGSPSAL